MREPRSAYLHIPFCQRRCFYCDFAVVPLGDKADGAHSNSIAAYLPLLHWEISSAPSGPPLSTVYLGGGTPSLLTPEQIGALLSRLDCQFGLAAGAEISMEMDPASFDQRRLTGVLAAGVNRVSLGGGRASMTPCWRRWAAATGAPTCLKPPAGWPRRSGRGRWAAGAST